MGILYFFRILGILGFSGSVAGRQDRNTRGLYAPQSREEKSVHYHHRKIMFWRTFLDTEYDRAKVPPYNGHDPPPAPGSLKALLFPPVLNEVQNKGTQGVQARYGAELTPFISIVRHPCRPVILGMDFLATKKNFPGRWWMRKPYENQENHIYHRNLSSVAPIFFSRQRKVLHWSRAMYAFFSQQRTRPY